MAASDLAAVASFNASLRYCSHRRPLLWWEFFPKRMRIAAAIEFHSSGHSDGGISWSAAMSTSWCLLHARDSSTVYYQAADLISPPYAILPRRRLSYAYVFLSCKTLCGGLGNCLRLGRSVALDGWLRREEEGDFERDDKGSDKSNRDCCNCS